jgi:predicted GIY-YIG superfamily endonuclease
VKLVKLMKPMKASVKSVKASVKPMNDMKGVSMNLRETDETDETAVYVYFISVSTGPVKIGVSGNPERRMADLQTAHYDRLHMVAIIECASRADAQQLEMAFHRWYASKRLMSEWFDVTPSEVCDALDLLSGLARAVVSVKSIAPPPRMPTVRDRFSVQVNAVEVALKYLEDNPRDVDLPVRELGERAGVGKDSANKARNLFIGNGAAQD